MQAHASLQLNLRQRRFVDAYLVHGNASRAASDAGYSQTSARQLGSLLLRVPAIRDAIRQQERERQEQERLSINDIVRDLKRIAHGNIATALDRSAGRWKPASELPDDLLFCLKDYAAEADGPPGAGDGRGGGLRRFHWFDKVRALEFLAKHYRILSSLREFRLSAAAARGVRRTQPQLDPEVDPGAEAEADATADADPNPGCAPAAVPLPDRNPAADPRLPSPEG